MNLTPGARNIDKCPARSYRHQGEDADPRVALALWVLRARCPDEWLVAFWEAAGSDHEIGRSQGLHAAYTGIVRQVRSNGGTIK
jgi:hypothetical protein